MTQCSTRRIHRHSIHCAFDIPHNASAKIDDEWKDETVKEENAAACIPFEELWLSVSGGNNGPTTIETDPLQCG